MMTAIMAIRKGKYVLIILCILCLVLAGAMWASPAQDPSVARQAFGTGAHLEQGIYSVRNTVGQPLAGSYGEGETSLCVGFWCSTDRAHVVNLPLVVRDY